MRDMGHIQQPRDRHCDARLVVDDVLKPPVLRRSTIRAICITWLLLVAYGTLGPLGVGDGDWLSASDGWRWAPPAKPHGLASYNDVFTNTLVYFPVGVSLALLLHRRGGIRSLELTLAILLSATLSYATELLQQFMPARCSDQLDLIVNTAAAAIGCLAARRAQNLMRRWHAAAFMLWRQRPWLVVSRFVALVILILMTVPWDLTWPSIEIRQDHQLDLLDYRRFGAFVVLGFAVTMAAMERAGRRGLMVREAIKRVFVLAVLFEALQIVLRSHACGLLDIGSAMLGGLLGTVFACLFIRLRAPLNHPAVGVRYPLAAIALVAIVPFMLTSGLADASPPGDPYEPSVYWLPFQTHFMSSFDVVVTSALESLLGFSVLTGLCLYLSKGGGRRTALLLLAGLVGVVQTARMVYHGAPADVTPFLLALVAWRVTIRLWDALAPQEALLRVASSHSAKTIS